MDNMQRKLVLATGNRHKVGEIAEILSPVTGLEILALGDFPNAPDLPETADTFEGNARMKAVACCEFTHLPSLADDSGLVIDALNGRPGIYSARYAPTAEERIARVLHEMMDIPDDQRAAHFIALVALALPGSSEPILCEGRCNGRIARTPSGSGGFGYDPIFYLPEYDQTMAELPEQEKNRISHRGRALQCMVPRLAEVFGLEVG